MTQPDFVEAALSAKRARDVVGLRLRALLEGVQSVGGYYESGALLWNLRCCFPEFAAQRLQARILYAEGVGGFAHR